MEYGRVAVIDELVEVGYRARVAADRVVGEGAGPAIEIINELIRDGCHVLIVISQFGMAAIEEAAFFYGPDL